LRPRAACDDGILEAAEQTAETLKNGWLHTGDIARADERGYMFISIARRT